MIAYFDTSAVLPLIVDEPGSTEALARWRGAERVASARIVYAEGRAALAQAARLGRVSAERLPSAIQRLEAIYERLELVEVSDRLVRLAGRLSEEHALRGDDAVHLAAASLAAVRASSSSWPATTASAGRLSQPDSRSPAPRAPRELPPIMFVM